MSATVIFFLLTISLPLILAKSCRTESGEDGICIPLQSCDAFKAIHKKSILFASDRELIHREMSKCSDGLHCCKRKPRRKIPRSYEDVKRVEQFQLDLLPNHNECGEIGLNQMIFNGKEAYLDQYPWVVLIRHVDDGETSLISYFIVRI